MKKISLSVIVILFLGTFCLSIAIVPDNVYAKTLFVGGSGPGNYTTIQGAVNGANPGDTIFVYSGTYQEQVMVDKPLSLVGWSRDTTFVENGGPGCTICVSSDWVNVTGFGLKTSGKLNTVGILLNSVHNCNITGNSIFGKEWGIYLVSSSNNVIMDNYIPSDPSVGGIGVYLEYSDNNIVENVSTSGYYQNGIESIHSDSNTFKNVSMYDNYYGMTLAYASNNRIINSNATDCMWGFHLGLANNNSLENNTATLSTNWGIKVWKSGHNLFANNTFIQNYVGMYFWESNGNIVYRNNISVNKGAGIGLIGWDGSHNNILVENTITQSGKGAIVVAALAGSNGNLIWNNNLSYNSHGIRIDDSQNNTIARNIVSHNNEIGIQLLDSKDNMLYHNCILNNSLQAYDDTDLNQWDDSYPSGGNYWSDYSGVDFLSGLDQDQLGADGIGDTPYVIDYDSSDRYPLMEQPLCGRLVTRTVELNIDPDTLNIRSRGRWITAYLRTNNAKAEDINASSLLLNDIITPAWWDVQDEDVLMVKFDRAAVQAILPVSDSVNIKITGQWKDGESFEVHDTIRVIDPVQSRRVFSSFLPKDVHVAFQRMAPGPLPDFGGLSGQGK
jgi:parallel beta-helix repeat protein